jgi:hypothetical protein
VAYITVTNKTKFPIHGAITWGGTQQWCFNNLQPGARVETDEFSLGWKDLTVIFGTKENEFNPGNNTTIDFKRLAMQALILSPLLFGNPVSLLTVAKPGDQNLFNLVAGPKGAGSGNFKLAKADFKVNPVTRVGLYAPLGNDFVVEGCEFEGKFNSNDEFVISKIVPLTLKWTDRTNHESGSATAPA